MLAVEGDVLVDRIDRCGDFETAEHNERVFTFLAEFIRNTRQRGGGVVWGQGVSGYIGTHRAALRLEAGQRLLVPEVHVMQPMVMRPMRKEDGPDAGRGLRLGIRSFDMRHPLCTPFDYQSQ
eukprot:CAMPEP_0183367088 /NCGR_PEP_ID=MMETSP0164_2-20130417/91217_1 /TAXON_ID=221442 /ORGANISM="Coccolithus pelagicus ssp braarudi, Strain PLY182g" /LENGTH=121 /DNA_ID=CAMNT_0025542975 /DNA_START=125 /DNA_END=488 /DNA_ORIENTATION=-